MKEQIMTTKSSRHISDMTAAEMLEEGNSSEMREMIAGWDSGILARRGVYDALHRIFPDLVEIETRCARDSWGGHGHGAGVLYADAESAITAGYTHKVQCRCGSKAFPLECKSQLTKQ